jgi:cell division protease FtsH
VTSLKGKSLFKTKGDIEHDVRVLLGGMANEELFFGEDGTTDGAHNDITRVTQLLHHAVGEMSPNEALADARERFGRVC